MYKFDIYGLVARIRSQVQCLSAVIGVMYNSVNICRSCLSTDDGLLSMESTIDDWLTISDCFKIHLNVNAREDDGLPFKICLVCLDTLLKVRKFHLRFLESEQRLLGQYVNPDSQKPEAEAFTSEIVNDVNDFDELPDFTSTADAQGNGGNL